MKKKIQHTIKPRYSLGNNELIDFLPLAIAVLVAYFAPLPFGFSVLIIYIGWELTSVVVAIKKYFPRSFGSYIKYKFGLSRSSNVTPKNIKEFAG